MTGLATRYTFSLSALIDEMADLSTEQIDTIIHQIEEMDSLDATGARDQVEAIRRLVGARRESERLRQDLGRIECHIVRRLGVLRAEGELPQHLRSPARHFAEMTDGAFRTALANYQFSAFSEVTAVRLWRFITGTSFQPHQYPESNVSRALTEDLQIRNAVDQLVSDLWHQGEVVDLRTIDSADPDDHNPVFEFLEEHATNEVERVGLKRLIYEAIKDGTGEAAPRDLLHGHNVPDWVTVRGEAGSYLHIPIRSATLDQFRWLVELRTEQARVVAAKANELRELAAGFERLFNTAGLDSTDRIGALPDWRTP